MLNEHIKNPLISLVIPCYNEADNIPILVERCKSLVLNGEFEIIFVDNGSTDGSGQLLQSFCREIPDFRICTVRENRGYGYGIYQGIKLSRGSFIGWTHADLQTDPADLALAPELIRKYGFYERLGIKGRRQIWRGWESIFTIGMSVVVFSVCRMWLWDINAQPNIYHRKFLLNGVSPPNDANFDLYHYLRASRDKFRFVRIRTHFHRRLFGVGSNELIFSKIRYCVNTIKFLGNECRLKCKN